MASFCGEYTTKKYRKISEFRPFGVKEPGHSEPFLIQNSVTSIVACVFGLRPSLIAPFLDPKMNVFRVASQLPKMGPQFRLQSHPKMTSRVGFLRFMEATSVVTIRNSSE